MPSDSDQAITRLRHAPPAIQFTSWPLRDEPLRTSIILGTEIALAAVAALVSGHWGMGVLVCGLLFPASWPLWLPVTFELSAKGIVRGVLGRRRRIVWTEFARYETYPRGVFLCHYSHGQPFAAVRGLFLPHRTPAELLPILDYFVRVRDVESNSTSTNST
jgi:hypothetical protein